MSPSPFGPSLGNFETTPISYFLEFLAHIASETARETILNTSQMPHADSSLVPTEANTKPLFYAHIAEQLEHLLVDTRFWVSFRRVQ